MPAPFVQERLLQEHQRQVQEVGQHGQDNVEQQLEKIGGAAGTAAPSPLP
eukprot:gene8662-8359_t